MTVAVTNTSTPMPALIRVGNPCDVAILLLQWKNVDHENPPNAFEFPAAQEHRTGELPPVNKIEI